MAREALARWSQNPQVGLAVCTQLAPPPRGHEDPAARAALIDPYSTGMWFSGWTHRPRLAAPEDYFPLPSANAQTRLLTEGWQLHGLIDPRERPGPITA